MKLTPETAIPSLNGATVGDFWSWAYSDIRSNRNRGIFAEFLVGVALGAVDQPRVEWDAYDLHYRDKRIEVKSAAYVQSWTQKRPSIISFNIGPKRAWDATTNESAIASLHNSECYVFCLHIERAPENANVLDLQQWEFYVVPTARLNDSLGQQKTIRLAPLTRLCKSVPYQELRKEVDAIIDQL